MKKQIFILMMLIAAAGTTTQVSAQMDAGGANRKGSWDLKSNTSCKVTSTGDGCDIVFLRDKWIEIGSSQKTQNKPFAFHVSSADNSVTEITSPKDASGGTPAGRASLSFTKIEFLYKMPGDRTAKKLEMENDMFAIPTGGVNGDCDVTVSWSWGASNSGSSKVCTKTFTLTIQDGTLMAINEKGHKGQNG